MFSTLALICVFRVPYCSNHENRSAFELTVWLIFPPPSVSLWEVSAPPVNLITSDPVVLLEIDLDHTTNSLKREKWNSLINIRVKIRSWLDKRHHSYKHKSIFALVWNFDCHWLPKWHKWLFPHWHMIWVKGADAFWDCRSAGQPPSQSVPKCQYMKSWEWGSKIYFSYK